MRKLMIVVGALLLCVSTGHAEGLEDLGERERKAVSSVDVHGHLKSMEKTDDNLWQGVLKTSNGDVNFYTRDGALFYMIDANRDYPLQILCTPDETGCQIEMIFIN